MENGKLKMDPNQPYIISVLCSLFSVLYSLFSLSIQITINYNKLVYQIQECLDSYGPGIKFINRLRSMQMLLISIINTHTCS